MSVLKTERNDAAEPSFPSLVPEVKTSSSSTSATQSDADCYERPLHDGSRRGQNPAPCPAAWGYEHRSGLVVHPYMECDSCRSFIQHCSAAQFSSDQTYRNAREERNAHHTAEANELRIKYTLLQKQYKEQLNTNADLSRQLQQAQSKNAFLYKRMQGGEAGVEGPSKKRRKTGKSKPAIVANTAGPSMTTPYCPPASYPNYPAY
ncbi:hypothetical protein EVG20_g5128 [Dentipellis fragilis]|uniref:Uncharacterized protein n=1 Tax=Dentipellis fragilis TaxID=205917 RepID=A0A4Y9YU79_9AGAM|nr:hypothetical protein EVG20_g5128 [Dentipellis fragilis]